MNRRLFFVAVAFTLFAKFATAAETSQDYFAIRVVDDQTGRGVPLVYLQTTYKTRYVTDSNGYVAFNEPGLLTGGDVWFEVSSYGYDSPAGPFGLNGVQLKPTAGGSAEIRLKRNQIAERLYRTSGYGIYRDSVLLGKPTPIKQPLLNAKVTGQDTIQTAVYHGKLYWLWQDTDRLGFGLGCFAMTGGTSALPAQLKPDQGIDITYFVDKPGEFARPMAAVPIEGAHPIWLDGLTVVKDHTGRERMLGRYVAVNKDMSPFETGLLLYNDDKNVFEPLRRFTGTGKDVLAPNGRGIHVRDGDAEYLHYPNNVRVKATFEAASDPANYEAFTCVQPDGSLDRNAAGTLRWAWRRGGRAMGPSEVADAVKQKTFKRDESPFQFVDVDTGKPIEYAGGSVAWNAYLNRWTLLFGQKFGDSTVGEIWLATANSPTGPWREAKKVATHAMPKNNNDFYNPIQHEDFPNANGRYVYFEGTFVNTFSGNPWPTPYYDYNNIMYRIDLADVRMKLPPPPPGWTNATPAD
ncbi:MAG: hypothetical protein QM754_03400 [Tepidisphaeraceae bacterium]